MFAAYKYCYALCLSYIHSSFASTKLVGNLVHCSLALQQLELAIVE